MSALGGEQQEAARAAYQPQGFRPKAWVAVVHDVVLGDSRGGAKRFATEAAALNAARAVLSKEAGHV